MELTAGPFKEKIFQIFILNKKEQHFTDSYLVSGYQLQNMAVSAASFRLFCIYSFRNSSTGNLQGHWITALSFIEKNEVVWLKSCP